MNEDYFESIKSTLFIVSTVASVLSFLGCSFIFLTYFMIRDLRKTPAFKMILHLAIATFLLAVNGLINVNAKDVPQGFCKVWGYLREHLGLTAALWPFSFAHSMYSFYTGKFKNQHDLNKKFKHYAILCWCGPAIVSIIPIFFDAYGSGCIYCWLDAENPDRDLIVALSMLIFYGPISIMAIFMIFYYIRILRSMVKNPNNNSKMEVYSMFFYPIGFIMIYAFAAIDRFFNIESYRQLTWMLVMHVMFQQIQGFIYAIIYGLSGKVREMIKQYFSSKKKEVVKKEEMFNIPENFVINSYALQDATAFKNMGKSPLSSPLTSSI